MPSYWYWRPLQGAWPVTEASTNRFDLPEQGALSSLMCRVYGTTARSLDSRDNTQPIQERTKLRIVGNGNFEIVNVQGPQLHAINFWDSGEPDPMPIISLAGNIPGQNVLFNFGRYPGDPDYGLRLERFGAGVQFEETNAISTSDYTAGTNKWDIYGLFRKNAEANLFSHGFLRKREICNETAASRTQFATKLPTLNKLRQIHIFSIPTISSGVLSTDIFTNVYRVWLSLLSRDEYIWNNMVTGEIARFLANMYGRTAETVNIGGDRASAKYLDSFIAYRNASQATVWHMNTGEVFDDPTAWLDKCSHITTANSAGTGSTQTVEVANEGICLHGDIPLLMQDPMSPETDWLDASVNKDVYVEVTENASTGKWQIVLDELEKMYPS